MPGPAGTCSSPGDFATGGSLGRLVAVSESQRFPGSCACPRPAPRIEAPRREPGGLRVVGRSRPLEIHGPFTTQPPDRRYQPNDSRGLTGLPGGLRVVGRSRPLEIHGPFTTQPPNPRSPPNHLRHVARARGKPVPSRWTLAAGILPSARSWETSLPPSWLRSVSQRRLDWHGLTPREPEFLVSASWKTLQAPRFARSQSPFPYKPPGASRGDCGSLGLPCPPKPPPPERQNVRLSSAKTSRLS